MPSELDHSLSRRDFGKAAVALGGVAVIVASARRDTDLVARAVRAVSDDSYADYVSGIVGRFVADVQAIAGDRDAFARVGATSLLVWGIDVAAAVGVLAAFGFGLTPYLVAVLFFAVSVGNLAKVVPLSPGGLGLYEGAFTLIVVGLTAVPGLTAAVALAVSIVDHAVKNAVTVVGGVAATLVFNVSLVEAVEGAADVEDPVSSER